MEGMKIGYRTGKKEEPISENKKNADLETPKSEIANPKLKKPGKKKGGGKD
jgi:hypothetical protein